MDVQFEGLVQAGHVAPEDVFEPGHDFHPPPVGRGDHVGEHIVPRVVGRLLGSDAGLPVELRMRGGEVPAAKIVVVRLRSVVRQRAAPRLPAGDAASVGERGHEQRVHAAHFLHALDHLRRALVHERHGPDLDADGRRRGGTVEPARSREGSGARGQGGLPYERAAADHEHPLENQVRATTS